MGGGGSAWIDDDDMVSRVFAAAINRTATASAVTFARLVNFSLGAIKQSLLLVCYAVCWSRVKCA